MLPHPSIFFPFIHSSDWSTYRAGIRTTIRLGTVRNTRRQHRKRRQLSVWSQIVAGKGKKYIWVVWQKHVSTFLRTLLRHPPNPPKKSEQSFERWFRHETVCQTKQRREKKKRLTDGIQQRIFCSEAHVWDLWKPDLKNVICLVTQRSAATVT